MLFSILAVICRLVTDSPLNLLHIATVSCLIAADSVTKGILQHTVGPDLFQQKGACSEGERPAIMVVEELLRLTGPVHHLVVDTGDVENQPHHQAEP